MIEENHLTKRYGKTVAVDQPVPLAKRPRAFTWARIVALVVIVVLLMGLTYIGSRTRRRTVSVPQGAHAGQLTMHPCTYPTENGGYRADCGTLVVPENRADPRSRLIALPVTRILARSSHPLAPIFHLNGGPGMTNMTFPQASRLAAQHDVVMVGYRGVDGSSVLNCPEVTAALENSADYLGKASLSAYSQAFASCAKRLERSGVDLAGYTLAEQADDIEAARVALGYKRIDLLSESAGTRLGDDLPVAVPEQCRPLGDDRGQPARELHLQRSRDRSGDRALLGAVRAAACLPRPHRQPRREHAAHGGRHAEPLVLPADQAGQRPGRDVPRAHGGDLGRRFATVRADDPRLVDLRRARRPERPVAAIVMAGIVLPQSFTWGEFASIGMADAQPVERYFSSGADRGSIIGNPLTEFLWGAGGLVHAWPANPGENQYTSVQNSNVPTLLIGGTLDFETPAQNATKELLPHLPNGHQVILSGLGHVDDFWAYEPSASTGC